MNVIETITIERYTDDDGNVCVRVKGDTNHAWYVKNGIPLTQIIQSGFYLLSNDVELCDNPDTYFTSELSPIRPDGCIDGCVDIDGSRSCVRGCECEYCLESEAWL